jgi:PAS domain S-box-containing protein
VSANGRAPRSSDGGELPAPDFRALFEASPGLTLVVDPDFRIVAVSDAFGRATMTRREQILGRDLFETFPDEAADPEANGVSSLRASLLRVIQSREADVMALQRHDVLRREKGDRGGEVCTFRAVNSPVLGSDGAVRYIIHRVEDVTELVHLEERAIHQGKLHEALHERAAQREAQLARHTKDDPRASRQGESTPFSDAAPMDAPLVLVVEDDTDMSAFLARALGQSYRVATACDGTQGLKDALELRPDLVISDVMMPLMTGDQLVAALRRRREMDDVPIVILTVKADEALRVSEARFRTLCESVPIGVFLADPEGRRLYANPCWLRITGLSTEKARDEGWIRCVHKDDLETVARGWGEAIARGEAWSQELRVVAPTDEAVWVRATSTPITGADGRVTGHVGVLEDISGRRQAEARLRLQAGALEAAANGIVITDRAGTIIWVNPAMSAMSGYSAAEVIGRNPRILKSSKQPPEVYAQLWKTILEGRVWKGRLVNRRKDGSLYHEEMTVTPLVGERGEITHFVAIKEDVSQSVRTQETLAKQERRLAASERRFRALLENATEGVLIVDHLGTIAVVNAACEALLGYTRDELIGQRVDVLLPEMTRERHGGLGQDFGAHPEGRRMRRNEITLAHHRDGSQVPITVTLSPALTDEGTWVLCLLTDLRPQLQADKAKRDFISTVSHELRTPLTSIRGSLGLLAAGAFGALSTEAQSLVTIASSNGDRLLRLINDLLDIDRIEAGGVAFRVRSLELGSLVAQAVTVSQGFAVQYGVALSFTSPGCEAWVNGDPDRLLQVLANLISNAVKYSPRGEIVSVFLTSAGTTHRVGVSDRGRGIPVELRGRIFEKFVQSDSSDARQRGGTGLGLFITKAIVEQHGGSIGFSSQPGAGTTFFFELPALRPSGDAGT